MPHEVTTSAVRRGCYAGAVDNDPIDVVPGWRTVPQDGALLSFERDTGRTVVRDGPALAHLRARAPRAVQFAITNACNLSCAFCNRGLDARSTWTADDAFALLSALAAAGTLEVAFGGGEPFAFRELPALLRRLRAETPLALGVTTNGTLLDEVVLASCAPAIAQLRVSVYDDNDWPRTVARALDAGVRLGVNVLVHPARLPSLPALVFALAARGVTDVLLLGYKGPSPTMHLSARQRVALSETVRALQRALPGVRFSLDVCFGDRLPDLPRVALGATRGDCGAGRDFVVITSDRRMRACTTHAHAVPFDGAADLLDQFQRARVAMAAPVRDRGCARTDGRRRLPLVTEAP